MHHAKRAIFIFGVFLSLDVSKAESRAPSYTAAVSRQSSDRYSGNQMVVGAEFSPDKNWRLGFGALRLYREYTPDAKIIDSSFNVTAARPLGPGSYFESRIEYSPDAEILPKSIYSFAPHIVFGSTDLALGFDYRVYQTVTAGSIHPTVRHDFSDRVALSAGAFVSRSDSTLTAYHGDLILVPVPNHGLRVSVAGGRTLEDAGISADFSSVYLAYGITVGRFTFGIDGQRYWSNLRSENSIGLKVEFK